MNIWKHHAQSYCRSSYRLVFQNFCQLKTWKFLLYDFHFSTNIERYYLLLHPSNTSGTRKPWQIAQLRGAHAHWRGDLKPGNLYSGRCFSQGILQIKILNCAKMRLKSWAMSPAVTVLEQLIQAQGMNDNSGKFELNGGNFNKSGTH